ncbi:MAG TPA: SGNH/GDSL hydrolase family protein [Acidimicrobiales bacterium]|nr:SGNH/GDSL hydrolase family protein [Acidimicrobiales bacterium]
MWRAPLVVAAVLLGACGVPGGEEPQPPTYAALGDSFSSGEGAGGYDAAPADCRRSRQAWPRLLDAGVELRACSGARTEHLTGPWPSRGLPPQIPTEPDPAVALVTLTIGGNEAGFGDILEACVVSACPSPSDLDLTALADALVDTVYPALEAAYPNARIVHVGYPRLTPPPGDPVGACFWLPPSDQAAAAGFVDAINGAIEAAVAASATDVGYLDVTSALADHELCTPSPWVTLVGRAHPTAAGQQALRQAVAAAL